MGMPKTKHFEIFNYWKRKFIKSNGEISDAPDGGEMIIWDWGEPCCWACGKPIISDKEIEYQKTHDFEHLWNDTHGDLEKCHIVPECLGGKDEPSNLFLLCPECHSLSPDTSNPASFFRWVYNRRKHYRFGKISEVDVMIDVDKELKQRGITSGLVGIMQTMKAVEGEMNFSDARAFFSENVALHFNTLAHSTKVALIADYLQKKWLNDCLDSN